MVSSVDPVSLADPAAVIRAHIGELAPRQRRAAQFIADHLYEIAFLSASTVAERTEVDPATIVRLCQRLGYRGFPDLQQAIRRQLPHYPSFVDRVEQDGAESTPGSMLRRSLERDRQNIERAMHTVDPAAFEGLVGAMLAARRIVLVSSGVSQVVTQFLAAALRMMSYDVRDTAPGGPALFHELALLEPRDLVLATGFSRYIRSTVAALQVAQEAGVPRAAVTDSPVSPLALLADYVLVVPTETISHRLSMVAALALAGSLVAAVTARDRQGIATALRKVNEQYLHADALIYP